MLLTTGPVGSVPTVFADAYFDLGLDGSVGAGTEIPGIDDLDALVLHDAGHDGDYTAGADMLFFSVRRGSAIIGTPDSIWGAPIEEGDILVPPGTFGLAPGIFIPAEVLGLATVRSGAGTVWGGGVPIINPAYGQDIWADELDALDVIPTPAAAPMALALLSMTAMFRRRRA